MFGFRLLPQRGGFLCIYFCFSLFTFFFFCLKKRKETNITVLKYCLTYSVSLGSVCAQDGAELTSASFCLEWGARWRGVGGARQCLSSMCLPASVPLPLPSTPTLLQPSLEDSLACEAHSRKKNILPSPPNSPASLCPCEPLPTNRQKYELVFLL